MHKFCYLTVFVLIFFSVTDSKVGRYRAGSDGNWYRHHQEAMNFTEAVKICQEDDPRAHLMTIKSAETKEFIDDFYKKHFDKNTGQHRYWLGLTDRDKEGEELYLNHSNQ